MTLTGKVYVSRIFDRALQFQAGRKETELQDLLNDFKIYWEVGKHLSFGKDSQFNRPTHPSPGIISLSIRKVHVRPPVFTSRYGPLGEQAAWNKMHRMPRLCTSNIYFIYAVNSNRDALVLAVAHNAHEVSERSSYMLPLMEESDDWYFATNTSAMEPGEHCNLWNENVWGY